MARITGLGGIFIKSRDPKALSTWYREKLGIAVEGWGGAMLKHHKDAPDYTLWNPFEEGTQYFAPSSRDVMINFAVDDLGAYLEQLEAKGVEILNRSDDDSQGKFAWIVDPDGTKIELWQPKT